MEMTNQDALRQVYKSGVRASYFNTMKVKYPQKSKIFMEAIQEEQKNVDENTFKLMKNFTYSQNVFKTYEKTGLMHIQTQGFFSCISSRPRYSLHLINTKLRLTRSQKLAVFIDFNLMSCKVQGHGNYFTIIVYGKNEKQFYFEPTQKSNSRVVGEWVQILNNVIKISDGAKHMITYLCDNDPAFYNNQSVSNEQFELSANTGDILLFKSEHSAARLQRIFTNSQYDHVGIVIRNAKNELFILQSTSAEGVGLTPWADMVKYQWYKSTQKIAYRRLKITHDKTSLEIIQKFILKTLGKGFQLSLQKIFKLPQQQTSKTYFCSELLARLYKELRLLDQTKSSSSYYPVDFSEKNNLVLVKNKYDASIGVEKLISFHQIQ